VEPSVELVCSCDLRGNIIELNEAVELVTGYSREEALWMNARDFLNGSDWDRIIEKILAQPEVPAQPHRLTIRTKDGGLVSLNVTARLVFENGGPVAVHATGRAAGAHTSGDRFTHHLKLLHHLSTTTYDSVERVFADYLETGCRVFGLPSGFVLQFDGDSGVVRALHGPVEDLVLDRRVPLSDTHSASVTARLRTVTVCSHREIYIGTPILLDSELYGTLAFCSSDATVPRQFSREEREIAELMARGIGRFIAEDRLRADRQRADADRLAYHLRHDSLTGLPNRVFFMQLLEDALSDARKGSSTIALLFIDLDWFKKINDWLGHAIGDRLLKAVGERLRSLAGPGDLVARVGGDEFTVVLMQPPEDCASRASSQFLEALRAPYLIEGFEDVHELFVTASIGIGVYPKDGQDAAGLLRSADLAMYGAKNNGKNALQVFVADRHPSGLEPFQLENALRRALERGELELLYQPMVGMDGKLAGLEALLSWNHPTYGRIAPKRFIPIAEETGLIVSIGSWVMGQACSRSAHWREAGHPEACVSVNVSALQFEGSEFVETVRAALAASGLPAACLELELTESFVMRDIQASTRRMAQLRELGVGISIDDFGTGYSSLSYLSRLPVNSLKIDQSFVRDLHRPAGSLPIVQTIVRLAHNMDLCVVAEGVETLEELNLLRVVGCDKVQGHLFGQSLRPDQVDELLAREDGVVPPVVSTLG
jgi:diguanylate cyclase (GGDEF)-like protein/PAS domain S-box-containing protein